MNRRLRTMYYSAKDKNADERSRQSGQGIEDIYLLNQKDLGRVCAPIVPNLLLPSGSRPKYVRYKTPGLYDRPEAEKVRALKRGFAEKLCYHGRPLTTWRS